MSLCFLKQLFSIIARHVPTTRKLRVCESGVSAYAMRGSVGGMLPWAMRALALCSAAGCLGYMVSNRPTPAVPREERRDPCLRLDERDKDELEIQQETPSWVFLSFHRFRCSVFMGFSQRCLSVHTIYNMSRSQGCFTSRTTHTNIPHNICLK